MNDFEAIVICNHPSEQYLFGEFLLMTKVATLMKATTHSALSMMTKQIKLVVTCLHENDSVTLDIIAAIRRQYSDVTIIVFSPSSMPEARQHAKDAGATTYVVLPITLEKFSDLMHALFPQLK